MGAHLAIVNVELDAVLHHSGLEIVLTCEFRGRRGELGGRGGRERVCWSGGTGADHTI